MIEKILNIFVLIILGEGIVLVGLGLVYLIKLL